MKAGYVALIGRPNTGKSTLLNRLVGQKISITSRRPHTTRYRIHGIRTTAEGQIVYVDTPGMHERQRRLLNRLLNRAASEALEGVDLVVWVDDRLEWSEENDRIAERLAKTGVPVIYALNKIDRLKDKSALLPALARLGARGGFAEIIPLSAFNGTNVERLEATIYRYLPEGEPIFSEQMVSDRPERFHAAEIIREKLFRLLGDELPYQLTVEIERFEETTAGARIHAIIWVERPSQKAIVIGKQGETLKRVGEQARKDLVQLLERRVFLGLWVKVKGGWSDDERQLLSLGFGD